MEILKKLAIARMQMEKAQKSSDNPFFKSRYADLSEVIRVVDEALSTQGLAVFQRISPEEGAAITTVTHKTRWTDKNDIPHEEETTATLYPNRVWVDVVDAETGETASFPGALVVCRDPKNPQEWGAAVTYARRFTLALVFNIAQEDDDGNSIARRPPPQPPKAQPPKAKVPIHMPDYRFAKMLDAIHAGTLTKNSALELAAKAWFILTDAQMKELEKIEENGPDASEVDSQP